MSKIKFISLATLAAFLGGCSVNGPELSEEDAQKYCSEIYVLDQAISGEENKIPYVIADTNYGRAWRDFYNIQSRVLANAKIDKDDHTDFWTAVDTMNKSNNSGDCSTEMSKGRLDFLSEFYKSASLTHENNTVTMTDKFTNIFKNPESLLPPKKCYYYRGHKFSGISTADSYFIKAYAEEKRKMKKCLTPYADMLQKIANKEPFFTPYSNQMIDYETLKKNTQKAPKAYDAFKILLDKNARIK